MSSADKWATISLAADYVRSKIGGCTPEIGIVLGSGLGQLAEEVGDAVCIPYTEIPGFPRATAIGHKGNLICGNFGGRCIFAMQGRFHYYEGYGMDTVTLPIRVMIALGIKVLVVSCAVGAVNKNYSAGDIMVITDHMTSLPNPLIGPNLAEQGPRFPDMTCAYDRDLIRALHTAADELGYPLHNGVLFSCSGPCYETPAEYEFFRRIGADVVGMSTTPEVIVARHAGIRVAGMAVITDVAHTQEDEYITDGEEIVRIADEASHKMTAILRSALSKEKL